MYILNRGITYCISNYHDYKIRQSVRITYGTLNSCFERIRSHQQSVPLSPPQDIEPGTTDCRAETLPPSQRISPQPSDAKFTSHRKCATT